MSKKFYNGNKEKVLSDYFLIIPFFLCYLSNLQITLR